MHRRLITQAFSIDEALHCCLDGFATYLDVFASCSGRFILCIYLFCEPYDLDENLDTGSLPRPLPQQMRILESIPAHFFGPMFIDYDLCYALMRVPHPLRRN